MRKFVLGDIHGSFRALRQVLELSEFDYEHDQLIFLGDVADGYTEVAECVEELLKIKHLIVIRGNHDIWLKDWLNNGTEREIWLNQGGIASVESYKRTGLEKDQRHIDFFNQMLDWYVDDEKRLFIHGGWDFTVEDFELGATKKVSENGEIGAMECHWNRSLFKYFRDFQQYNQNKNKVFFSYQPQKLFKEIYIGHTQLNSHFPETYLNLTNMDSGAGWNGRLSMMDIDTKEIWQSNFSPHLYP
ncbi:MAG TPA: metallophosphoesterase [Moheibacter sp.]|nr:metallophosphoesterase [Moheibacter sp.]